MPHLSKIFLLLIFSCSAAPVSSQSICSSALLGTNEPPGCLFCEGEIEFRNNFFSPTPVLNGFSCGEIENNVFFLIQADKNGEIKLTATLAACGLKKGLEAIFYNKTFEEVSDCLPLGDSGSPVTFGVGNLNPGEVYTLMLDGIDGDFCDIKLLLESKYEPFEVFAGVPKSIIPPPVNLLNFCTRSDLDFSIPEVPGATFYQWNLATRSNVVRQNHNKITFNFGNTTLSDFLHVTPYKSCSAGRTSDSIRLMGASILTADTFFQVCPDRLPIEIDGLTFENFLVKNLELSTAGNCDSIVFYHPVEKRAGKTILNEVICVGDVFEFDNRRFSESGFYQFPPSGNNKFLCDTLVELTLEISGEKPPEIYCIVDTFLNILSFNWDRISLADGYRVFINGEPVSTQSYIGYIHPPNFTNEEIEISIEPFNARGCSFEAGTTTCLATDISVGVAEKSGEESIRIFPNPSSNIFKIRSFFDIEKIEALDVSGRLCSVKKTDEIDLSNQPTGIYFLKIFTKKGMVVKRVVKK